MSINAIKYDNSQKMKGTEAVMQMLKNAILEKGKAINQDFVNNKGTHTAYFSTLNFTF